jgi:hypothetical protein
MSTAADIYGTLSIIYLDDAYPNCSDEGLKIKMSIYAWNLRGILTKKFVILSLYPFK